jgi:Ca-activated chloride channel family protein
MNHFERPLVLWAIPLVFVLAYLYYRFGWYLHRNSLTISSQKLEPKSSLLEKASHILPFLRWIALVLLLISLAGPGQKLELLPDEKKGIDMMFAIDVSGSMTDSVDFLPSNRLEVSKELLLEFVKKRIRDRMGVVVFAGSAYLQAPLTGDQESLKEIIKDINRDSVFEQGTAIGDAIILSTYRLKKSTARSKIILLFTDGVSNMGKVDMKTAAETSKEFGIKIYTIGIGKDLSSEIDFQSLEEISSITKGKFYRAIDSNQLEATLKDIDQLERDKLDAPPKIIVEPYFQKYLYAAILILFLDLVFRTFVWKFFV